MIYKLYGTTATDELLASNDGGICLIVSDWLGWAYSDFQKNKEDISNNF